MKKKLILKYRITILILILIIAFLSLWILIPKTFVFEIFSLPALSTLGYTQASVSTEILENYGKIKLSSECYELSMIVDKAQAISIENGLNRKLSFRPYTHDLINDMLRNFGIEVLMVKINNLKNNTYFANLLLKQGGKVLSLDSRPSDAIAIATRTEYLVPILVNETLLKEVGEKIC